VSTDDKARTIALRPARSRSSPAPTDRSRSPGAPVSGVELRDSQGLGLHGTPPSDAAIEEVMFAEESIRARGFAAVIVGACLAVAAWVPWLGGDPIVRYACLASLLVMTLASLWFRHGAGQVAPAAQYRRLFRTYGWIMLACVLVLVYYCGVFSPVAVVLAFGIQYFGQSVDRKHALLLTVAMIGSYFVMAALTAVDVLPELGLYKSAHAGLGSRVFATVAATLVLALMLSMARLSRVAVRQAIGRSRDALLVAQQREAQLVEAHHQLDAALRATIGKPGRYTGALAGDYRMGVVIGLGAIGEIYSARHEATAEPGAVKVLQAAARERDDLVERILREAAISGKLDNSHVVKVFETGRLADGEPYLAMELLRGRDLAARLREEGKLTLPELMRLAKELGTGLQHAHDAGVIHRDLKPLNVFDAVEPDARRWKILDFGISKLISSSGTLTRDGILGTPGYMSPEQARSGAVDRRSDIFAMGALLYRALTGQRAFRGENTPQILFEIVYCMPRRPSAIGRNVPESLDAVLAIALAKRPEDRFDSALSFAQAFVSACEGAVDADLLERASKLLRAHPWGVTRTTQEDQPREA
jgi:eukaryotic-like serine/threonine-protein kinase